MSLSRFVAIFILFLPLSQFANPLEPDRRPILEALAWMKRVPQDSKQLDYVMTARVRLLFFWAGKDDVGGGYIRRSVAKDDPRQEIIQVLFGSDPARAPRAINRWGAGTEVVFHKNPPAASREKDDVTASAFFGFMKSSQGKSAAEMQAELKKEKDQGEHRFTGILSRAEPGKAVSLIVSLSSLEDYNLRQYPEAEPLMFEKLSNSERLPRILQGSPACARSGEFLNTVSQLVDAAVAGNKGPISLCYVYDAQVNTLTLERVEAEPKLAVKVNSSKGGTLQETEYANLLKADFVSMHQETGKKVYFTLFIGTEGMIRGIPVQIRYQPNWWFQVVLNLKAPLSSGTTPVGP